MTITELPESWRLLSGDYLSSERLFLLIYSNTYSVGHLSETHEFTILETFQSVLSGISETWLKSSSDGSVWIVDGVFLKDRVLLLIAQADKYTKNLKTSMTLCLLDLSGKEIWQEELEAGSWRIWPNEGRTHAVVFETYAGRKPLIISVENVAKFSTSHKINWLTMSSEGQLTGMDLEGTLVQEKNSLAPDRLDLVDPPDVDGLVWTYWIPSSSDKIILAGYSLIDSSYIFSELDVPSFEYRELLQIPFAQVFSDSNLAYAMGATGNTKQDYSHVCYISNLKKEGEFLVSFGGSSSNLESSESVCAIGVLDSKNKTLVSKVIDSENGLSRVRAGRDGSYLLQTSENFHLLRQSE